MLFRLRQRRSADFPLQQRAYVVRRLQSGRTESGRGGEYAVPRLRQTRRRMVAQPLRRQRERGSGGVPQKTEHCGVRPPPESIDDRGRIHRVADGDKTGVRRRFRFQFQVEYGLDERHARLRRDRSAVPRGQAQQPYFFDNLRVQRKLHIADFPRRSGTRQTFARQQDAGRLRYEVRGTKKLPYEYVRAPR